MTDPINDEELRRSRRLKSYQQYQNQIDEIDKMETKARLNFEGDLGGKKVKKIVSENSPIIPLFHDTIKRTN